MNEKILKELSEISGISSFEDEVSNYIKFKLDDYSVDGLRSVIYSKPKLDKDDNIKLLFATHMDEVGFIVKDIDENGFIKLQSIGSLWSHMLLGQPCVVKTFDNKKYCGIIGSPATHGISNEIKNKTINIEDIYLDMGVASKQEIENLGIEIGNSVTFDTYFKQMNNPNYYCCKAFDNRVSCFIGLEVIERIKEKKLNNSLYWCFTSQEEVGLRGARSSTALINPDVSFAIDTTLSGDTPLNSNITSLGKGVVLSFIDSNSIYHRGLIKWVENICKEKNIPYQFAVFNKGGTDSGNIHKTYEGNINMTLSIPIRYMHTSLSIVHKKDIEACIELVCEIINRMNVNEYNKII